MCIENDVMEMVHAGECAAVIAALK